MRDRLWRIRQTPQKFHYLDWCEKIKEKYSSREEYGFAGATLTFLQGEKESEQKKSGEERRLMLFFQNLIFCWQNSIGVKISIGNARILEESVRTALELSMKNLSMEEEKRFSREVKIARDLLAGKGRTEAEMRESPVFCRWQDGFSWEEISGIREIREYADSQKKTLEIRRETARIRSTGLTGHLEELQGSAERGAERSTERSTERNTERSTETASGRSTAELPESRMVYLEPGERKKDSAMESRETTEVKKNIDRLRKETAIQREKLTEAEKKLQTERVEAEARILERERQIERELQLEKKRQAERELQSENQRQTERKLRSGKENQAEEQGPKIDRQQLEKRQQTEEKRLSESRKQPEREVKSESRKQLEREVLSEGRKQPEREVLSEGRKQQEREVQSESRKQLEREVLSESSEQPEGEPQSEKERQIESEIHLQEQKEELQIEFRKQIEKEFQRERDSQREDLIRREGRFLQFPENTDEYAETDIQAEPAGNEQLEMPESHLVYLTQTEKQEETPGVGALKTEETILQASSRIREEKRELEDRTRQFESEKKQLEEKLYKTEKILRTEKQREIDNVQRIEKQLETERLRQSEKLRELERFQQSEKLRELERFQQPEKLHELERLQQKEKISELEKRYQLEQHQTEQLLTLQQKQDTEKQQETEKRQQVEKLLEIERQQQIDHRSEPKKTYQFEKVLETEKFQQEVEKERQEKKKLESEFIQQTGKKSELEFLQQLGKNSESQSEIDRESQWEKQLELEQAPLPELPEAQLIYRNQENQSGSLPMDRSSDQDQTPSQRDRLEQFLPMTAAGKSALVEQKIINERTNVILKSLLSEFQPSARQPDTIINLLTSINRPDNKTKLQVLMSSQENQMKLRTVMNDLGNAEKVRSLTEYPESITKFHTLMSHPENAAKFKTVTAQAENTTKFRTIMSRSESTAGSQSVVNPMSGANPMLAVASRISESGGYPSNSGYSEILPGITRFRTRRGAPGSITEIRMISGIRPAVLQILKTENDRSRVIQSFAGTDRLRVIQSFAGTDRLRSAQNFAGIDHLRAAQDLAGIHPLRVLHRFSDINPANSVRNMNESDPEMIHIPDLAGAVKIQYADHGKHRQDQTASNSDVLAMSAKLTQTREETRILKRDSGFTRSTLIEQEKKINGLRQELREQMQTVNEEVKRLINTQKQDASVRNMADRVMKELQKQFRTEKIRRGY